MKVRLFFLFFVTTLFCTAQNKNVKSPPSSPTFHEAVIEKSECISDSQREEAKTAIFENKRIIEQKNPNAFAKHGSAPLFIIPLQAKAGFDDYGYYIINNQVDHNTVPNNNLLDYQCNKRTYDWATGNHKGTDYVLYPYPWKRMDQEIMEVIAAASGIIIQKRDGFFDKNCVNAGNPNWNGIMLQHDDGSQSWYWHFKNGAITSKNIGDTVEKGEYLGAAGSSGSSTIPHLHFEVYDSNNKLIDPYSGPCNSLNSESWWENQPDYFIPTINRLSTHSSQAYDSQCPISENTYEKLDFVAGEEVVFRIFWRDLSTGDSANIKVKNPNGTTRYDYGFTSPYPNVTGGYTEWIYPVDNTWQDGIYTITVSFAGQTFETKFGVGTTLGTDELVKNEIALFPNPASDKIMVQGNSVLEKVSLYNLLGRKIMEIAPSSEKAELNLTSLQTGLYIVKVESNGKTSNYKVMKQ